MNGKGGIIAGVITLVIGGTAPSVSQEQVVDNFSKDTGMSQQEAQNYVDNVNEDDLSTYTEVGEALIKDGEEVLGVASEIDCNEYEYEWETSSLTCSDGKAQMEEIGESEVALGTAYKILDTDSATKEDIAKVIALIDRLNENHDLQIVSKMMDDSDVVKEKQTLSYNKSLLQAALDSE